METREFGRRPTRISEEDSSASLSVADVHLQGDHDARSLSSSSDGASATYANDGDDQEDFVVEKGEDKAVWTTKLMFLVFMTCCTIGVCLVVYKNTREAEQELFEGEFEDFSLKLLEALSSEVDSSLSAIDSLVVSFVSLASFTNMTWPFVLIPDAGPKFAKVQSSTGSVFTAISPIITAEDLDAWNDWSISHSSEWIDENLRLQENDPGFLGTTISAYNSAPIFTIDGISLPDQSYYLPVWQGYPTANAYPFNFDMVSINDFPDYPWERQAILSPFVNAPYRNAFYNDWLSGFIGSDVDVTEPVSEWYYPIYEDAASEVSSSNLVDESAEMVGVVWSSFYWHMMFHDILPEGIDGMVVVVENTCNDTATYVVNGPHVEFLGYGDGHDPAYNGMVRESTLKNLSVYSTGSRHYTGLPPSDNSCSYSFRVYPSDDFEALYITSKPVTYTLTTVAIFIFTVVVFGIYDFIVERRQAHLVSRAVKASALVSSLFPSNVRDRLLDRSERQPPLVATNGNKATQKSQLKSWVHDPQPNSDTQEQSDSSKDVTALDHPIADLFPEVTVMFGDIAGFTAWSSTRSPGHVFILLETLYGEFDRLATKRGVFKVETIGDCYLAVAGLPEPRDDHGITMVKFANSCCAHMGDLLARLSVQLGPDTEDLAMRFGLNSGPVTAGVLRGQKSRFQLFGDTVNTASRMESLGERNRIHVSQSTADELIKSGKGHWLRLRRDTIEAKGKGRMVTYWVEPYEKGMSQTRLLDHSSRRDLQSSHREDSKEEVEQDNQNKEPEPKLKPKPNAVYIDAVRIDRLVSWNVDVLSRLIRGILAHNARKGKSILKIMGETINPESGPPTLHRFQGRPIDEVTDIFNMPAFDPNQGKETPSIDLDPVVTEQLRQYVAAIAATYHGSQNPFHNFEHASHVCMSVSKLTHRLVSLEHFLNDDGVPLEGLVGEGGSLALFKHEKTFGIASDPLALFACCFSALIHDAKHPGVTNAQLVHESSEWTQKYGDRSIAEQSSVDVAWELLMENRYQELRTAICPSQEELIRLRQMIVNCVIATDLLDPIWNDQRSQRWSKAFDTSENTGSLRFSLRRSSVTQRQMAARKATVVMESLLQASDISHTMQHWNVYLKWNKRLFAEMHKAYENGRAAKSPSEFWYQGELAFFDHCVLPLAKRIKDCGMFGVSSEEYLNYATKNREEWERRGKEVVAEMTKEMTFSG
eukprot:Nitzschia sp. Nitz4//scaffold172_size47551//36784//40556//NITZ4_007147-RA/size47551-augustus-gene-0.40-mRNA-1//1//CDS//3329538768//3596//frame0